MITDDLMFNEENNMSMEDAILAYADGKIFLDDVYDAYDGDICTADMDILKNDKAGKRYMREEMLADIAEFNESEKWDESDIDLTWMMEDNLAAVI